MPHSKRLGFLTAVGFATIGGAALAVTPAHAEFIVTIEQVGSNVVVNGSGSIDLTDLRYAGSDSDHSGIVPYDGSISIGSPNVDNTDKYSSANEFPAFGDGGATIPSSSGSGSKVIFNVGNIWVPSGYVSGAALSDSSTYDNATFASLGLTDGTYTETWGSGRDADSAVLEIGPAALPEPDCAGLLALPLAALGLMRRGRGALWRLRRLAG